MNPNILMLLLFSRSLGGFAGGSPGGSRTQAILKRVFPVALTGSLSQRVAVAAIVAEGELRRQEIADEQNQKADNEADKNIIKQVVDKDGIKSETALKEKFSLLYDVYINLPQDLRVQIDLPREKIKT
jgi:hypothetical protein